MSKHITITVRANPDLDDCLQGAVDEYVSEHPETEGYDFAPRWADDSDREMVEIDVPGYAIDGYTGSWQEALRPRRYPSVGDVVALAEDADAREWDDFRSALHDADGMLWLSMTGDQDTDGRDVGVVRSGRRDDDGELIVW